MNKAILLLYQAFRSVVFAGMLIGIGVHPSRAANANDGIVVDRIEQQETQYSLGSDAFCIDLTPSTKVARCATAIWTQSNRSSTPSNLEPLTFNSSNQTDGFEDTGRPANQTSTGSRGSGSCLGRFIAVVPGSEPITTPLEDCLEPNSLLALTLNSTPTFWFYVPPEQVASDTSAEFALLDENQRPIYRERVSLNGEPGIISVQLSQPLELNRIHRWVFQVFATGETSQDPAMEGFIKRIEPDSSLSNQLAAAISPQERVRLYANYGVWHDALTELAELRRANPTDAAFAADWVNLLASVGLAAIATAPLSDCCTSQPVSH